MDTDVRFVISVLNATGAPPDHNTSAKVSPFKAIITVNEDKHLGVTENVPAGTFETYFDQAIERISRVIDPSRLYASCEVHMTRSRYVVVWEKYAWQIMGTVAPALRALRTNIDEICGDISLSDARLSVRAESQRWHDFVSATIRAAALWRPLEELIQDETVYQSFMALFDKLYEFAVVGARVNPLLHIGMVDVASTGLIAQKVARMSELVSLLCDNGADESTTARSLRLAVIEYYDEARSALLS